MRFSSTNCNTADMVTIAVTSLMFVPSCALAFSHRSPAANSPLFRQRPDQHRLTSSPTLLRVANAAASTAVDEAASVAVDNPAIDNAANADESPLSDSDEFNWYKVRFLWVCEPNWFWST